MIALSVDVEEDFPPYYNTNKGLKGLERITSLLREKECDATFFICADYLDKNPQIADIVRGFEVGCHGLRHVDYSRLSDFEVEGELREAVEIFKEHGFDPKGFRAPYARVNRRVLEVASMFFDYDSSLTLWRRKAFIKEANIFMGGKGLGINSLLFDLSLKFPVKDKVFFIHPWEYGGFEFKKLKDYYKSLRPLGYSKKNYDRNLGKLLDMKTVRVVDII